MKKILFVFLLIVCLLTLSSCNLSQGTQTLPAPKATSPSLPLALTVTTSPAAAGSATSTVGLSKTALVNPTSAKTTPQAAPSATKSPAAPTAAIDPTYPADPNGVVQAFVTGYPDNTAEMLRYLSSSLKGALPNGRPAALLKIQGDINGFAIISGSQTPQPSEAVVVIAMQAGGNNVQRTFNLSKENNRWVINSIN